MKLEPALRLILVAAALLAFGALAGQADAAGNIVVQASPAVLNLNSAGGTVSLHTDVDYSAVNSVKLSLDGQAVTQFGTFADARGDLVVRCDIQLIKGMVSCPSATFDLDVLTDDGLRSGTDTIKVINVGR